MTVELFTQAQLSAAINAEVADWSAHWNITGDEEILKRIQFHRDNLAQREIGSLGLYLGIVSVMAYRLPEALAELMKLARKAERYGATPISWKIGDVYPHVHRDRDGRRHTIAYADIILSGLEAPKVGNYTFLAKAEITPEGVIVDTVPGESLPVGARERLATGRCEHCNSNRRRNSVFLVRDPNGTVVQVGRTCLGDYLGTNNIAGILSRFRFSQELRGLLASGGFGRNLPDLALELLAVTATAIRLWGWVPKSAPESAGMATAARVSVWFYCPPGDKQSQQERKELEDAICDKDWETAEAVMAWVASSEAGDSEYIQNLRVILAPGAVEAHRRGYACSAVAAYQRYLGRLAAHRREAEAESASQWVGKTGDRVKGLKLTCLSARTIESHFGYSVLYKMRDEAGNIFSWFSSGGANMDPGSEYLLDATIKDHGEYRGVKETQLTRGRVYLG